MFNWIKNLFCRPCEQYYSVVHIIYEVEPEEEKEKPMDGFFVIDKKQRTKKKKKGKK